MGPNSKLGQTLECIEIKEKAEQKLILQHLEEILKKKNVYCRYLVADHIMISYSA